MARRGGTTSPDSQRYQVSFLGQFALAAAIIMYLFSTTFDPEQVSHFFTMILILISGIVLTVLLVGMPKIIPFSTKSLVTDLIATAVAVVAIYYTNQIIPLVMSTTTNSTGSPIGEITFGILAGVAEEWFFRSFLCCWAYKLTHSYLVAVPMSSFVWAIFHTARYGASMDLIWLIFFAGLPLGFLTLYFRSADGPTFGHMIVNALAGLAARVS